MSSCATEYSNLNLLPHNTDILLKSHQEKIKFLKLMIIVLEYFESSANAFLNGEVEAFDPHVGDTLCQIRAYKIVLLNNKGFNNELRSILALLPSVKENCQKALEELMLVNRSSGSSGSRYEKFTSLNDFFSSIGGKFFVDKNTIFIVLSYILTKFSVLNECDISVSINYQSFSNFFNSSLSYSKKIICFYQKILSELSCEFIENILSEVLDTDITLETLLMLRMRSENNRMVMPCFLVSKIIFCHILKNRIPIRVRFINNESSLKKSFILVPTQDRADFQLAKYHAEIGNKYPIELYVSGSYEAIISMAENEHNFSFKRLIMANQAAHPQYSGKKLQDLSVNPFLHCLEFNELTSDERKLIEKLTEEIKFYQDVARTIGCCKEKPFLFYIMHILCGSPGTVLELSSFDGVGYTIDSKLNLSAFSL